MRFVSSEKYTLTHNNNVIQWTAKMRKDLTSDICPLGFRVQPYVWMLDQLHIFSHNLEKQDPRVQMSVFPYEILPQQIIPQTEATYIAIASFPVSTCFS